VSLGPEMKSTGEVLGLDRDFDTAVYKGLLAAGYELHKVGSSVLMSVKDADKPELVPLAKKFVKYGYDIIASEKTARYLNDHGVDAVSVDMDSDEGIKKVIDIFDSGAIDFVVSTSKVGRKPAEYSVQIRRKAIERSIATLTSIDTANALVNCLLEGNTVEDIALIDICKL